MPPLLSPEAREWLDGQGITPRGNVRRLSRAVTAELLAFDDYVLRWYERGDFLRAEPDAIRREVAALTAMGSGRVPAPRLIAWSAEPPAILMTRLSGRHAPNARHPEAIRDVLSAIHATDPTSLSGWSYRGYHEGRDLPPPTWWRDRPLWSEAMAASAARKRESRGVLIHRDFHPGNILWSGARISGVVDWGNACVGPAGFDLAHYRVNLATLLGSEETDAAFPGDPAWDVEAALGFIDPWSEAARDGWTGPWPRVPKELARRRIERFLANALVRLR